MLLSKVHGNLTIVRYHQTETAALVIECLTWDNRTVWVTNP